MEELSDFSGKIGILPKRRDSWFTVEIDPSGIVGGADKASGEKGEKLTGFVCRSVIEQLNSLEE